MLKEVSLTLNLDLEREGCENAIFALRQICEEALQHGTDLDNMMFVDRKTFDIVYRNKLRHIIEQCGVKDLRVNDTNVLYDNRTSCVRPSEENTD